ncbi:hypothetical protein [Achromobacter phage Motura]|uniref:Uncharacterized protein n=1 Tax=Achromobacter phage Motura TaxID=2591403 RepID=A0A514CT38_9CAUD|nr:hypothetical protein H1O15_gp141 [Achromobacter phage Motura]QDH83647.1 hypothetical protein [Achromobacter phage Motura]
MPSFRTPYEQQQWNNLDKQSSQMFERLKKGQATSQDLKDAQSLVAQYSVLASTTFEEGVKAMYMSAEAAAKAASDERVANGGAPFDEVEFAVFIDETVTKIVKDEGVELALTVEDIIKSELTEQDDRTSSLLEEKIKQFQSDKRDELLDPETEQRMAELREKYSGSTEKVPDATALETTTTRASASAPVSQAFEAEVTDAAQSSMETDKKLRDLLDEYGNENWRDKHEEEKASIWWRKFQDFGGGKVKAAGKMGLGLIAASLGLIARTAMMELSGAEIWKKVESWFSLDSIKEMGSAAWEYISRKGRELADWISGQFKSAREKRDENAGVKDTDTEAVKELKIKLLQAETRAKEGYALHGNEELTEIDKKEVTRLKSALEQAIKDSQKAKGPLTDENGNPITLHADGSTTASSGGGGSGGGGGGGSTVGGMPATPGTASQTNPVEQAASSTVNNQVDMSQTAGSTTVNQDQTVTPGSTTQVSQDQNMTPAVSVPAPGSAPAESASPSRAAPQAGGAQTASLATIPNQSGMTDFLGMYNFGMFT